ncbi:MAG: STAS domain-containing protein [Phycisphaeraceae bacterium]|nr:STAS domain-containing protein [Phycisphaeraceae bacterium]
MFLSRGSTATRRAEPPQPDSGPVQHVDLPPLPQTLFTLEEINGMNFVRIDCPALRERQAYALTDPLLGLADRAQGRVTIDMTKVAAFCCAWLNVMVELSKRCKQRGGELIITGLNQQSEHMLRQFGMHKQFKIVNAGRAA